MEFRILGPLEVVGPGGPIRIGGPLPRAVLALLVLNVGRTVTGGRLIDEIWGEDPPRGAQHALEVHVAALRRALGPDRIETQPNGYRLRSAGSEVDLERFESLVSDASRAFDDGDPQAAATALAAALHLWRGPALGDLAAGNAARAERARLDELRAFALERRIDAELACGHHLAVVPELRRIIGEMPLREAFSARLMLALYRSGRQADALEVYHRAREVLDRELGVEPGPELEALQRAILDHDPLLDLGRAPVSVSPTPEEPTARVGRPIRHDHPARNTRRTVTTLMADISGSTLAGEPLDPKSARLPMDRCLSEMQTVLERYGGTVERVVGEAIMAVFGLPVVHEDDALRAVHAAAEMRTAVNALSEVLVREIGVRIEMRIGLNTGEVITGGGAGSAMSVTGNSVNTAGRLAQAAAPGEIRLGARTYELVRDAVQVTTAQATDRNGHAEPLVAYRLHGVTGTQGHRRRLDAPIVGRERELDVLKQAFDRAVAGRSCQLFTILGTAGVGKSRLVAEFTEAVRDRARVVRGRCLPYGEGITYWPIAEIVRQVAGIEVGDSAEIVRDRIDAFAAELPESAAIARGLVGIIGLDASASRQELVWAFRRALEHLADERPLVVVVEDLHWAEPTLLDLLESVADIARDAPMLLACPARPEFLDDRPAWGGGKFNATTILLEPLADESSLKLIDSLSPVGALPAAARAWIADAAEGNPLYVEEFLAMLLEDGARGSEGRALGVRDLDLIGVPPTIQALLAARLDRLLPDERAVVERASVVGRTFDEPSVVALCSPEARAHVPGTLTSLVRKELIRRDRSGLTRGEGFRFRHILIRDAAYERLPKAERAYLHERFGGWLDLAAGDRRTEVEELVGYHLEQAVRYRDELAPHDDYARDVARRAAQRLIAAGRRAFERSDIAGAVNLLSRASTLLEPADPARLAILPDLGRALDSHGRFEEARACFAEAVARAEAAGDERAIAHARVLTSVTTTGGAWRKQGAPEISADDVRRVADECHAIFERLGDDRGLALSWRLRAEASRMEGSSAGREAALVRALDHARRAGAHWEESSIVWDLSIDLFWGPTPVPDAIRRCHDILANAPDDRAIEMPMTHALAHMHARLGAFELARSLALRCREIAAESGQRYEAAVLTEVVGDVEMLAGEFEAAERALAEGNEWFATRGERHPILEANLASARTASGRSVDAERLAAMAAGERAAPRAMLEGARAAALVGTGRLVEAERAARGAVDFFATTDFLTWHADTALILGDVLRSAGRHAEADGVFRQALDLFRRKGSLVGERTALARLAATR